MGHLGFNCSKISKLSPSGNLTSIIIKSGHSFFSSQSTVSETLSSTSRTTASGFITEINLFSLAAFGFCFGGCCALELARTGAPLKAAVSFHGTLDTTNPADAKNIKGKVLVLHGASDPLVPKEQLPAFEAEMNAANVDWQLLSYGGAFHSFTDPHANNPGVQMYNPTVSKRAFTAMHNLLDEVFAG